MSILQTNYVYETLLKVRFKVEQKRLGVVRSCIIKIKRAGKSSKLTKRLITAAVSLFIIFVYAKTTLTTFEISKNLNSKIQTTLEQDLREYSLPGLSVSIQIPSEIFTRNYVAGYDTINNNRLITKDTLFQIGSLTKTFTASIILKLNEDKKLHLNDKIGKWLSEYPRWRNITINNLLNHSSGIYNYTHGQSFDRRLRDNPHRYYFLHDLADTAYRQNDLFAAGERVSYSNTDYILLGMIIERATKHNIQQIFDQYLQIYNLSNTFFSPAGYPSQMIDRIAHGYNRDGTFKDNTDVTHVTMSFGQSSGAMVATANDLNKWLQLLFNGQIINFSSLKKMTSLISTEGKSIDINTIEQEEKLSKNSFTEIGFGLGMGMVYFRDYGFAWVHAGGSIGYESLYVYNPCKGIYFILLYNAKPKEQLIFIRIAENIFQILDNSPEIIRAIHAYQASHKLPEYCQHINGFLKH